MTAAIPIFSPSEPIPGYLVRERLGAGGYGEVWRAEAPGGLSKAVKIIFGCCDDERAAGELAALNRIKQVSHPFLLSLERIERVAGHLVIVTELATSNLKQEFDKCREAGLVGIPRNELLAHLHDAADALDYISQQHSLQHLERQTREPAPRGRANQGRRLRPGQGPAGREQLDRRRDDAGLCRPGIVRRASQSSQRPVQPGHRLRRDVDRRVALRGPHHGAVGRAAPPRPPAPGPLARFRRADDRPRVVQGPDATFFRLPGDDRVAPRRHANPAYRVPAAGGPSAVAAEDRRSRVSAARGNGGRFARRDLRGPGRGRPDPQDRA